MDEGRTEVKTRLGKTGGRGSKFNRLFTKIV